MYVQGRFLCRSSNSKGLNSVRCVLLFLVILGLFGRRSGNAGLSGGIQRHIGNVELEVELAGDVLNGERACLVAVECHGSKLQLACWRYVIPNTDKQIKKTSA